MFNWLVSPAHSESNIPKPPRPNLELVEKLRQTQYNPRHYYLPEDFNQQIREEYQKRELSREIDAIFNTDQPKIDLERSIKEIETFSEWPECDTVWSSVSSESTKTEIISAWGSPEATRESDSESEASQERRESDSDSEESQIRQSQELYISIEDTEIFEWHSFVPFQEESCQDPFQDRACQDYEQLLATSQQLDAMENQPVEKPKTLPVQKLSPEHPEGFLELYIGPMFSGKSTKAFFKLSSMADQRFRCIYINSAKDVRETESNDNLVSTHNSSYSQPSRKITCVKTDQLSKIDVSDYEYVAVDELQFFSDAYDTVLEWVDQGKYVIVASLDGDCYRRKFGSVLDLIPHANQVTKLTAYCDICRDNYRKLTPAPFTARMTSETTSELVGGKELYQAMCRNCHDFHLDVTSAFI